MIVLVFEVLVGIEGFVTVRCESDPQYHLASISAILDRGLMNFLRNSNIALLMQSKDIRDKFEIKKGTIKKFHKSLWKTNSLCKESLNCSLKNITWPIEVSKKKGIIITTTKKPLPD